ncbi:MAG: thiol:disulfide interchange protein DsbA [Pantoea sp. Brub]|nr:thiol:disulfide interchange protein DsbA [Pantoea sp. Brub]
MNKKYLIFIILIINFNVYSTKFINSQHYINLPKPFTTKFQIIEFFSFFCQHCYDLKSIITNNTKKLPITTKFIKYHVNFLGGNLSKLITHAWAMAIALGIEDKVIEPIFNGIQKNYAINNESTLKKIFIKSSGISNYQYDEVWNSVAVAVLIAQQEKLANNLNLKNVPSIIINGKYLINNDKLDNSSLHKLKNNYFEIINYLIHKK